MYYIYYGSLAAFQLGGKRWRPWKTMIKKVIAKKQARKGHAKGSWDPIGPWGLDGGRVYSTALLCMICQVHYRYDKVFGARPLSRVIQEHIKKPLTDELLFGRLSKGGLVRISVADDELVFTFPDAPVSGDDTPVVPEVVE